MSTPFQQRGIEIKQIKVNYKGIICYVDHLLVEYRRTGEFNRGGLNKLIEYLDNLWNKWLLMKPYKKILRYFSIYQLLNDEKMTDQELIQKLSITFDRHKKVNKIIKKIPKDLIVYTEHFCSDYMKNGTLNDRCHKYDYEIIYPSIEVYFDHVLKRYQRLTKRLDYFDLNLSYYLIFDKRNMYFDDICYYFILYGYDVVKKINPKLLSTRDIAALVDLKVHLFTKTNYHELFMKNKNYYTLILSLLSVLDHNEFGEFENEMIQEALNQINSK